MPAQSLVTNPSPFPKWQAGALVLLYVLLGYVGIEYAAFPGTFFAQVWLPSGVGLLMFSLFGQRALPLVWLASLLVNAPYAIIEAPRYGLLATAALVVVSPLLDSLQGYIAWRWWRPELESRLSRAGLQRLLVGALLAVSISVAGLAALQVAVGIITVDGLLARFVMMVLSDMQGVFLVVPLALALRQQREEIYSYSLFFSALAIPMPLILARYEASLAALVFPLVAFIIINLRFVGAATAVSIAGGSAALMVILGQDPLSFGEGVEAFSRWSLIVLALGTPMLLMGVVLDDNEGYRNDLEARVAERTQALQQALAESHVLATTDSLTGLYNRRHMEQLIHEEVKRTLRYKQPTVLIVLDIDHFKEVNDHYGHPIGDTVLRTLSDIIRQNLRQSDACSRWGGEEFLILLPQIDLAAAARVAEKLRIAVASTDFALEAPLHISLGIADLRSNETAGEWIKRADQALYKAKNRGRNQIALASE